MGRKPTCSLEEFKKIAKFSIKQDINGVAKYTPFLLEGSAGIGKTSAIIQMVDELSNDTGNKWGLYIFDSATRTANDLFGVPDFAIEGGEKVLKWVKDGDLPRDGDKDIPEYGIFFCTEITSVQEEQLKVGLLDLLSNKEIAGYKMPKNWYILADGNGLKDGNVYSPLSFPIRNRFRIMEGVFDKNVWLSWANKSGVHKSVIKYISSRTSKDEYISYDPELEDNLDEGSEDNYVCATPRSWESVSDALAMYEGDNTGLTMRELELLIQSSIGTDIGKDFFDFYVNNKGDKIDELNKQMNFIDSLVWENGELSNNTEVINSIIERMNYSDVMKTFRDSKDLTDKDKINIMFLLLYINRIKKENTGQNLTEMELFIHSIPTELRDKFKEDCMTKGNNIRFIQEFISLTKYDLTSDDINRGRTSTEDRQGSLNWS